jgi:hypothetical protein
VVIDQAGFFPVVNITAQDALKLLSARGEADADFDVAVFHIFPPLCDVTGRQPEGRARIAVVRTYADI